MLDTRQDVAQKAQIIQQFASLRKGIGSCVSNRLIMHATFVRIAQKQNQQRMYQEHVFDGMSFFLAAITARLFRAVLWAWDGTLGTIMKKGVSWVS